MTSFQPPFKKVQPAGLTLIETAAVIVVMLGLIWVLFIGMTAWKSGAERSNCLVNIRNVQVAARSYQNLYAMNQGAAFSSSMAIGPTSFVPQAPVCPGKGTYTFVTTFTPTGALFMNCSETSHVPPNSTGW